VAVLATVVGFT